MDEFSTDYLAHYGVLGMKWGVRHDPKKAYQKASKKFDKIEKKSNKAFEKAAKFGRYAKTNRSGELNRSGKRAIKYRNKSKWAARKGERWLKKMNKEFAKQDVVSIEQSLIDRGSRLSERYKTLSVLGF